MRLKLINKFFCLAFNMNFGVSTSFLDDLLTIQSRDVFNIGKKSDLKNILRKDSCCCCTCFRKSLARAFTLFFIYMRRHGSDWKQCSIETLLHSLHDLIKKGL